MIEVVIAALRLPDGRIVFQRRTAGARVSPSKLGFFGGHVELGETLILAIKRELSEETSLDISSLRFKHCAQFQLESDAGEGRINFNIYEVRIPNADFSVHEGQGSETYTIDEALSRSDLTTSAKYVLEKVITNNQL